MRYGLLGMMLVMLVLAGSSVLAATSTLEVLNPAASSRNPGTIVLRTEVNGSAYNHSGAGNSLANISNVTWEYQTDRDSTWVIFATNGSNTGNGSLANWTISAGTLTLEDVRTYTWRSRAWNNSNNARATSATIASVTFDNTVPSGVFGSLTPADNVEQRVNTVTINTEANINASSCVLHVGIKDYTVSPSSDVCSKQVSSLSDGSYTIYWVNTDGLNSTTGASRTLKINAKGISGAAATKVTEQARAQEQIDTTMLVVIGSVIVVVIVVGGAYGVWRLAKGK